MKDPSTGLILLTMVGMLEMLIEDGGKKGTMTLRDLDEMPVVVVVERKTGGTAIVQDLHMRIGTEHMTAFLEDDDNSLPVSFTVHHEVTLCI